LCIKNGASLVMRNFKTWYGLFANGNLPYVCCALMGNHDKLFLGIAFATLMIGHDVMAVVT
jgi:hypothetical protein